MMAEDNSKLDYRLFFLGVLCTCGLLISIFDPTIFGRFAVEAKIGFGIVGLFFYASARRHDEET